MRKAFNMNSLDTEFHISQSLFYTSHDLRVNSKILWIYDSISIRGYM